MSKIKLGSIVVLCFEFDKMYDFWKEALHYQPVRPLKNGFVILKDPNGEGSNTSLDKADSRFHFDLYTDNQQAEVNRLLSIGAKSYPWRYPDDADYVVLEDPDGNLFCVVQT